MLNIVSHPPLEFNLRFVPDIKQNIVHSLMSGCVRYLVYDFSGDDITVDALVLR